MEVRGFRRFWSRHLDALATEVARGRRARRTDAGGSPDAPPAAGAVPGAGSTDPPTTDKDET